MYVPFELEMPRDLAGALNALAAGKDSKTVPIAGGTNLIVDMRAKRERPDRIVGLGAVGELRGNGVWHRPHFNRRRHHRHRPAAIARDRRGGALARRVRAPVRGFDGPQYRHRGRQHRLLLSRCGSGAAAALARRRRDACQRLRDPDAAARPVFPRIQARRPTARRAHHPHFLAAPARAVGQHLLQARPAQGRRDHRHRGGADALRRRRDLHEGAHRARGGSRRSCFGPGRPKRCWKAGH